MHSFQIRRGSDSLIDILLPNNDTIPKELKLWESREFRLSPKDHWEGNGMLQYLKEWRKLSDPSILAIFGPTRERDTWVTEFSLDMIQAFKIQNELVAFALCDRPGDEVYTPFMVVKKLICQLLEQKPELVLERPRTYNSRVFQSIQNFTQAWGLLENMVIGLERLAILIDHVDRCQGDINDSSPQDLVGCLSRLVTKHGRKVDILITSTEDPPEHLPPDFVVSVCMISTQKRPFVRGSECARYAQFLFVGQITEDTRTVFHREEVGLQGALSLYQEILTKTINQQQPWRVFKVMMALKSENRRNGQEEHTFGMLLRMHIDWMNKYRKLLGTKIVQIEVSERMHTSRGIRRTIGNGALAVSK
jgi:hypothetical protein